MTYDIEPSDCGSIMILSGTTDSGVAWLRENVYSDPWQWLGPASIAVEPRMGADIIDAAREEGIEVWG